MRAPSPGGRLLQRSALPVTARSQVRGPWCDRPLHRTVRDMKPKQRIIVVNRAITARVASLACAVLTLSIAAPATAATSERAGLSRPQVGNVQKAMDALAKTTGVVGAIGEV